MCVSVRCPATTIKFALVNLPCVHVAANDYLISEYRFSGILNKPFRNYVLICAPFDAIPTKVKPSLIVFLKIIIIYCSNGL